MRRSEARRPGPVPVRETEHRCSVSRSATAGQVPAPVSGGGGRTPGAGLGCVGAYWKGSEIRARFRTPEGALVEERIPVEHSFFLRAADADREISGSGTVGACLRRSRAYVGERREGDWVRVVLRDRDALQAVCEPGKWAARAGVDTFEGDLHPVKRWMLDEAVRIGRPRRVYLDIEAYLPHGIADHATGRTLAWALSVDERDLPEEVRAQLPEGVVDVCVGRGMLEADSDLAERVLLEELLAALDPYDQVLAWNGDRFDFPFLEVRAERLGVAVEWRRWLRLDHMVLFQRMNMSASESGEEKQSFALAAIASIILGEEKVLDLGTGTHVAWKAWLAGGEERERLSAYNIDDTGKMVRIERETGYVELHQTLCEATRVLPDSRTIGPKQGVESYLMRLGRERGMRFPSFFGPEESHGQYEGAFVLEPTRLGIVENVHVFDFSRQYPTAIRTLNLSPETHVPAGDVARLRAAGVPMCRAPKTGEHFRTDYEGLLPIAIGEILTLRKRWDDEKSRLPPGTDAWKEADRRSSAYKIAANSFYGVIGSIWSRFFKREVAEGTSTTGAFLIRKTLEEAERRGMTAIYGDTDSGFVQAVRSEVETFVAWCNAELYPTLARECGALKCEWKLAYEKAFEVMVLVTAKRYAGRYSHYKGAPATEKSKPEVKGLEYKRGDVSRLARAMQTECLDMLLGGGVVRGTTRRPTCERDPEKYRVLVDRWRSRILNRDLDLVEILVSKRLSKEPEHYKRPKKKDGTLGAPPPQVRAAFMARERGKDVGAGVRVEYVVADAREKTLVLAEDYDGTNVDRVHLWENLVYPATMRVLQACFPAIKWEAWRRVRQHIGKPGQVRLFEF